MVCLFDLVILWLHRFLVIGSGKFDLSFCAIFLDNIRYGVRHCVHSSLHRFVVFCAP